MYEYSEFRKCRESYIAYKNNQHILVWKYQ